MARGVNMVILIGNLGKDIESRTFPSGDMVANTSLATSESWNDKQTGERKEHTEWHNLVFRKKGAEIAKQYLRKGSKVYIEGTLRSRKYQDRDGGKERYITEIIVRDFQMLDGRAPDGDQGREEERDRGGSGQWPTASRNAAPPQSGGSDQPFEDDDIPF